MTSPLDYSLSDRILDAFTPGARVTLVADPDGLVDDERVLGQLRQRGCGVLTYDPNSSDLMALRYQYESEFRLAREDADTAEAPGDSGVERALVILVNGDAEALQRLPWDLLSAARSGGQQLRFGLADLFPNLHTGAVTMLARADLDALYHEQSAMGMDFGPQMLGKDASTDFILGRVFGLDMQRAPSESDALVALLRLHETRRGMSALPGDFANRVAVLWQGMQSHALLAEWPLERLLTSAEATYAFLQERWPAFVRSHIKEVNGLALFGEAQGVLFAYPGPSVLPFDHAQVRPYIDTLFLDGRLRPIDVAPSDDAPAGALRQLFTDALLNVGIRVDAVAGRLKRLARLLETLSKDIPGADARHTEWIAFALRWAEAMSSWHDQAVTASDRHSPNLTQQFMTLQQRIDEAFGQWMLAGYAGLHNLSPLTPAMVHHIPRALARQLRANPQHRCALVVIDGLALDQWRILREVLLQQRALLSIQDGALFAWAPTVTPVSRQALFAGQPPALFPDRINTSGGDEKAWGRFWAEQGLRPDQVGYVGALRSDDDLPRLNRLARDPSVRALGVVFDTVDEIMHGTPLGMAGMRSQVRLWAERGILARALDLLLENDFDVVLTADHGNIEAQGIGLFTDNAVTELRDKRVRVYPSAALRSRARERFPDAIRLAWPQIGLPPDYFALLAPGRKAFAPVGQTFVTHGGVALEEMVVPYVFIGRHAKGLPG